LLRCKLNFRNGSKARITALQQQWPVNLEEQTDKRRGLSALSVPMTSQRFSGYATAPLAPSKGLPAVPNMRPMVAGWTA
jgi:hypothetical protein